MDKDAAYYIMRLAEEQSEQRMVKKAAGAALPSAANAKKAASSPTSKKAAAKGKCKAKAPAVETAVSEVVDGDDGNMAVAALTNSEGAVAGTAVAS